MSSATSSRRPRCSVIIVTYNSRENIRVCLESLRRCAKGTADTAAETASGDQEIIVVDNNSRDGTQEYLSAQGDVRAILNTVNNGFSKGCNQGADIATGEFLIFLNPDTLVTPGWSDNMARYFRDPAVGAAGPVSNYVAGLQRLDLNLPPEWRDARQFPGDGPSEVAATVARILAEANSGKGVITKILIGFCLMIKRSLFASMGGMDERLFLGNDDLDLSWRLRSLGLKLVVASDAFVFHEGQKSFKTEAKSHVDRLVQESTDALYVKLVEHYGGWDKVPSATELWGIGWFNPSPSLIEEIRNQEMRKQSWKPEAMVKTETREQTAWKGISALLFMGPDKNAGGDVADTRLKRSLSTLPARPGPDILILNCSGRSSEAETPAGATLRKLDLGAACTPKQSLEIAINLLPGTHALFAMAGVQFSTLFNHWLDKRDLQASDAVLPLPLRVEDAGGPAAQGPGGNMPGIAPSQATAFLCRKDWLRQTLGTLSEGADEGTFLAELGARIREDADGNPPGKASDPPWLLAHARDLSVMDAPAEHESWTPVTPGSPKNNENLLSALKHMRRTGHSGTEKFALYPESLRPAMRAAGNIGFAGSAAETPSRSGGFRVYDPKGDLVPLAAQDLVILRVTPEMIDGLDGRIRNLKRLAADLRRLIVVFNGNQALRLQPTPKNPLIPIDLTADGVRAALLAAGFAVTGVQPYRGFPEAVGVGANLEGWIQVEAVPRETAYREEKLVSIVILGFNQVEYTRKCIESIRKHTRQRYELILVDNGSKDGTEAYFRSLPGARVIRNAVNLGVAKGWNQGMRLAKGEYILILNNDVIVGPDWLENMVRLAESDPAIGLVGPRSNYIAGPQIVPDVPYKTEAEIQAFIGKWQAEHALAAAEFGFIKGFCHLIPRKVFTKVGFYDERYGKGNFEDDDYCMRVHCHGYRAMMAHDSFIHHYGSVSFNQESVDWQALMIENQKKYSDKWAKGPSAIHDTVVADPAAPASPVASMASVTYMAPMPPGMISPAAQALAEGARAYERGDFPAALAEFIKAQAQDSANPETYCNLGILRFHQGALRDAATLFLRCLELDPLHADAARNLIDSLEAGNGNVTDGEIAKLVSLFPRNETLAAFAAGRQTPAPSAVKPQEAETSVPLPAWKADVEKSMQTSDFARVLDIVEPKLRKGEDSGACYNYLGIVAHACGDRAFALEHFRNALKHAPTDPDIVFNLADTLVALGRPGEAARFLRQCAEVAQAAGSGHSAASVDFGASAEQLNYALTAGGPDMEQILASREANQKGESLLRSGNPDAAKAHFLSVLEKDPQDFRAFNNLGLTAWYKNLGDEAWKHFTACLSIRPAWTDALVNAFETALALQRIEDMRPYLEKALAAAPGHPEAAAMQNHMRREGPAIYGCKTFEELQTGSSKLDHAETAMKNGGQGEAIRIFLDALETRPRNPQALNGLGIIAFGEKRYPDAFGLFESAASMHPMDQDILMNLWQSAQALRRERDVLPKLKLSLERNPAFEEVKAVVREYA